MKRILLALALVGCTSIESREPRQVSSKSFESATLPSTKPILSLCQVEDNNDAETRVSCRFANGSYTVAGECVAMSFWTHSTNELVMVSQPICSGYISHPETIMAKTSISGSKHSRMTRLCGSELERCYIRIDPVERDFLFKGDSQ